MEKNRKWLHLFSFFVILYILLFFSAMYILPVVKPTYEFSFGNFFFYTYLFNSIVYLLKITLLYGFFKMCLFIFDIKIKYSILSIVVFAEITKLVLIKGAKIISFYLSGSKMSLEQFRSYESNFRFTNIFNISTLEDFKYIINFIDVFDLLYMVTIVFLFINYYKLNVFKSFKIIGFPYLILLFIIGIFKTFISF